MGRITLVTAPARSDAHTLARTSSGPMPWLVAVEAVSVPLRCCLLPNHRLVMVCKFRVHRVIAISTPSSGTVEGRWYSCSHLTSWTVLRPVAFLSALKTGGCATFVARLAGIHTLRWSRYWTWTSPCFSSGQTVNRSQQDLRLFCIINGF